jgi:hypothetical protein
MASTRRAIHVWELTPADHGVLVHTEESWDGEPVRAQTATLQQALDASLRAWLRNLKRTAERNQGQQPNGSEMRS